MALPDWIRGMLLRPAETFAQAQKEMRYAYLWILLCVFTIEAVMLLFHPDVRAAGPGVPADLLLFNLFSLLFMIFSVQVGLLFWSGLAFGWRIRLADAMKYTGLIWVFFLAEDVVTFVPALKEQDMLSLWLSLPFLVWRIGALTAGIRAVSGLPPARTLAIALMATLPWQLPLLYLNWTSLNG
ncbi:NADH:ubiquinone oxidoreductase subunit 3 (subunit A) [Symbiobacterium terraclitae]|uniref:NADH:ubiquinone oxidoreductase subunit 3 (Subunit A) n=1 Tax=Symbiobacterium terraclitae TaxID=557451 RepID=A0ABS4JS09_9FIRM|nr:hypothetical protein [Symbiobacterium terraclitae]MBP2018322.1 NADH:ubiquinone oxidoreductase subunit 3 (subunit A) [Symbiobacterium terraclitae]